ncbi:MAG: hypothetical protein H7A49_04610 [Akkermansiaceae bacterium]|nr:hypothetical protein [Akkermansiaceae bacterium]
MSEENWIYLWVLAVSASITLLGFVIWRIVRANGRNWARSCLAWWNRGSVLRIVERADSQVRANRWLIQWTACVLGLLSALACIGLPIAGATGYGEEFDVHVDWGTLIRLLVPQLIGPLFLSMLGVAILIVLALRQRVPRFIVLFTLVGALFTSMKSGDVSHEFDHVLFDECAGPYGSVIWCLCMVVSTTYTIVCVVGVPIDHARIDTPR